MPHFLRVMMHRSKTSEGKMPKMWCAFGSRVIMLTSVGLDKKVFQNVEIQRFETPFSYFPSIATGYISEDTSINILTNALEASVWTWLGL